MKKHKTLFYIFLILFSFSFGTEAFSQRQKLLNVGVARIDITPETPVRLTGYSNRDDPFTSIHHRLWAKALAFGNESNFGKELVMIFLAGEVVVDYSLRLKREIGADRIWVNSYANDMPCYIPSLRVLREGGYEAETAMIGYEKPSKFTEDVEEIVMRGIYSLLPPKFKP